MSSKSLPRVLTIYLLVLAVIIVAAHASSSEEEICRDGRCYPRAFAPTTDFTEVLEGQEIPPGLHVRMDFNTGKKEAKLFDSSATTISLAPLSTSCAPLRVRPRPRNVSRPSRSSRISFIRLISGSFWRRETGFRFFSRLRLWIACQREPEVNAAAD